LPADPSPVATPGGLKGQVRSIIPNPVYKAKDNIFCLSKRSCTDVHRFLRH